MTSMKQPIGRTNLQKLPLRKRIWNSWKARAFASSLMLAGAAWCGYDLYSAGIEMNKRYCAEETALLVQSHGNKVPESKKRDIIEHIYSKNSHMKLLTEFIALCSLPVFILTTLTKSKEV